MSNRLQTSLRCALLLVAATTLGCEPAADDGASADSPVVTKFFFSPVLMFVNQTKAVECKVGFQDANGDITSVKLLITNPDGTTNPEATIPVTTAGQSSGELKFSFDATPTIAGNYRLQVTLIDAAGNASAPMAGDLKVDDFSEVENVCALQGITCDSTEFCYNIEPDSCQYMTEHGLSIPECDKIEEGHQPRCVSSLEDAEAEYAAESQCGFIQWWSNPTSLKADCRCATSAVDVVACRRPADLPKTVGFGEGPRLADVSGGGFQDLGSGPMIGREWFLPTDWNNGAASDQAMIWAVNIDTAERRMVSGAYVDTQLGVTEIGEGESLKEVYHLAKNNDDELFAVGGTETMSPPMIWQVDTASGQRTLVYDTDNTPDEKRCPNGNLNLGGSKVLQLHSGSLAIDDEGHFYLASTSSALPGPSIVKIDKDTDQCSYVTAVVKFGSTNSFKEHIGGGYDLIQFPFRGVLWHNKKIYAISDTNFVEVDPATGDRRLISKAKEHGGRGTGPVADQGLGNFWTLWDPHHEMFWTVGGNIVVAVNPETGDRTSMPCWHPGLGLQGAACNTTGRFIPGVLERGGMVFDPDDPRHIYFAHDNVSVVKYDNHTSNAVIHSL